MISDTNINLATFFDNTFNKLDSIESLIIVVKNICLENEISSNYYNAPKVTQQKFSEERNHYINLLTLAIEKLNEIKKENSIEEKCILNLQQNPNNCCRKVATESSAN